VKLAVSEVVYEAEHVGVVCYAEVGAHFLAFDVA
jgi:hypothetical protein